MRITDALRRNVSAPEGGGFFQRIDWSSFWTSAAIAFAVYFLTLGPSVGLEDSGELAVAGDHLGVPHPPGYPIWTMISFLFARIFGFVTFRGQPTPAWAISLGSAVFGALAAGCTAMLITRSARDMLRGSMPEKRLGRFDDILCWTGGVAGSLVFAFSPVMWSQSTIVEVYSLGAFFLMLVMLLTYRWMKSPSDKILWLAAFVFGLGLTNYQVLLLSALPLVIIIFLRNTALFRDFILVAIPMALGAIVLKIGASPVQRDLPKLPPVSALVDIPFLPLVATGLVLFAVAFAVCALFFFGNRSGKTAISASSAENAALALFGLGALSFILSAVFSSKGVPGSANPSAIALDEPCKYLFYGAMLLGAFASSMHAAVFAGSGNPYKSPGWYASLFFGAIAVGAALLRDSAPYPLQTEHLTEAGISMYNWIFAFALIFLLGVSSLVKRGLLFAFPVSAALLAYYILAVKGAVLGLTHPTTWWFAAPVVLNFLVLLQAAVVLPLGKSVSMTILMAELGVSFYAYMPVVSDLRNPPMNWGYPRTWEGFKHAITRGQYEKIAPVNIFSPRFIQQLGDYFIDLRRQFTLLLAPLGFLPFAAWRMETGTRLRKWRLFPVAAILSLAALVFWGIDSFVAADLISDRLASVLRVLSALLLVVSVAAMIASGKRPLDVSVYLIALTVFFVILGNIPAIERFFDASRIDKLTFAGLLLLSFFGGAWMLFGQFAGCLKRLSFRENKPEAVTAWLAVFAAAVFFAGILYKTIQAAAIYFRALGRGFDAEYIESNWAAVCDSFLSAPKGLLLKWPPLFASLAIVAAVFMLFCFLSQKKAVKAQSDDISQQWMIGTVCNFAVMSVILIMLANPKGDLQDTFIQKVKFISSHGLFALWIGYGIVYGAEAVARLFSGNGALPAAIAPARKPVLAAVLLFALLTPLIPVHQNYFNDQLVFELGGAEQNGHDYGWQFGNYQLRGAEAILEELSPDEEPPPNPLYPKSMEEGAIFFGGTDPGRFVPTYMIYSADVRPDVFLITQNALADNTFMSVTRDLYGDKIWIPTPRDSENAFALFVEEVRTGKRPPNSDIVVKNGKVQVVGALGVMEINGILCRMIFDHNKPGTYLEKDGSKKPGHEFYLEESYTIPWMYPYLVPHGLVMHIRSEETPLGKSHIRNDSDFWDWYLRRLTSDNRYRRDVVAQKSFSKLRSAIAGLYLNKGFRQEGERAYNEARMLYPASPESNFRLVQDVYLRQNRFEEAMELLRDFGAKDPNNDRIPMVSGYVGKMLRDKKEHAALMEQLRLDPAPRLESLLAVATLETRMGMMGDGIFRLRDRVDDKEMSVGQCYRIARIFAECGDYAVAMKAMRRIAKTPYVRENAERFKFAIGVFSGGGDYAMAESMLPQYLKMRPDDWQANLDYARLMLAKGNENAAAEALLGALRTSDERAISAIEGESAFVDLLNRRLSLQNRQGGF